jgi:tritrans,polycis-undecaprenyl-diphosphate synthase [geranylgeranyl-diphosphate specific]
MSRRRVQVLKDLISRNVPEFLIRPAYGVYRRRLISEIKSRPVPTHVGIIMDGNRRLARNRGLPPQRGHEMGLHKAEEIVEWCHELGIRILTVYAFSTENFHRPKEEVDYLMSIFEKKFNEVPNDERFHRNRVRVRAVGDLSLLPERVIKAIERAEASTREYDDLLLNICIAYGGRGEIIRAFKEFLLEKNGQEIYLDEIDVSTIRQKLFTGDMPDPELIIRTGGEMRLSNFLLFQAAYAELFFVNTYFPLFREIDFLRIIREFQSRNRRFGR